jgi:biopolymer transport protein ExbB
MSEFWGSLQFIFKGGFMMIPLLISALLALTVSIDRLAIFGRAYKTKGDLLRGAFEKLKEGKRAEAEALCKEQAGPVGAVLAAGIEHLNNPLEEMELAMKNEGESWVPRLERRIHVIDTVITAAPLMGLLGTITGMMASFRVLSDKGVNDPGAITGGVSEALIATATGLVIALLCLVAYNYLTARIKELIYEMESAGSRLVELRLGLERRGDHANLSKAR